MTYPLQYFRIAIGDTDNNIASSGSSLIPSHHTGKTTEKWYLNYVKKDTFQILNASSNQIMTGNNSNVSLSNYSSSSSQHWTFQGVQNDYDGYTL